MWTRLNGYIRVARSCRSGMRCQRTRRAANIPTRPTDTPPDASPPRRLAAARAAVSPAPTPDQRTRPQTLTHGRSNHALGPCALRAPRRHPRRLPPDLPAAVQAASPRRLQARHAMPGESTSHRKKVRNSSPPNPEVASSRTGSAGRAAEASAPTGPVAAALLRRLARERAPAVAAAGQSAHAGRLAHAAAGADPGAAAHDGAHRPVDAAPGRARVRAVVRAGERRGAPAAAQALQAVQAVPAGRGGGAEAVAGVAARARRARVRVRAGAGRGGLRAALVPAAVLRRAAEMRARRGRRRSAVL